MSSIFLVDEVLFNSASRVATVYSNRLISSSMFDMVDDLGAVVLLLDAGGAGA